MSKTGREIVHQGKTLQDKTKMLMLNEIIASIRYQIKLILPRPVGISSIGDFVKTNFTESKTLIMNVVFFFITVEV